MPTTRQTSNTIEKQYLKTADGKIKISYNCLYQTIKKPGETILYPLLVEENPDANTVETLVTITTTARTSWTIDTTTILSVETPVTIQHVNGQQKTSINTEILEENIRKTVEQLAILDTDPNRQTSSASAGTVWGFMVNKLYGAFDDSISNIEINRRSIIRAIETHIDSITETIHEQLAEQNLDGNELKEKLKEFVDQQKIDPGSGENTWNTSTYDSIQKTDPKLIREYWVNLVKEDQKQRSHTTNLTDLPDCWARHQLDKYVIDWTGGYTPQTIRHVGGNVYMQRGRILITEKTLEETLQQQPDYISCTLTTPQKTVFNTSQAGKTIHIPKNGGGIGEYYWAGTITWVLGTNTLTQNIKGVIKRPIHEDSINEIIENVLDRDGHRAENETGCKLSAIVLKNGTVLEELRAADVEQARIEPVKIDRIIFNSAIQHCIGGEGGLKKVVPQSSEWAECLAYTMMDSNPRIEEWGAIKTEFIEQHASYTLKSLWAEAVRVDAERYCVERPTIQGRLKGKTFRKLGIHRAFYIDMPEDSPTIKQLDGHVKHWRDMYSGHDGTLKTFGDITFVSLPCLKQELESSLTVDHVGYRWELPKDRCGWNNLGVFVRGITIVFRLRGVEVCLPTIVEYVNKPLEVEGLCLPNEESMPGACLRSSRVARLVKGRVAKPGKIPRVNRAGLRAADLGDWSKTFWDVLHNTNVTQFDPDGKIGLFAAATVIPRRVAYGRLAGLLADLVNERLRGLVADRYWGGVPDLDLWCDLLVNDAGREFYGDDYQEAFDVSQYSFLVRYGRNSLTEFWGEVVQLDVIGARRFERLGYCWLADQLDRYVDGWRDMYVETVDGPTISDSDSENGENGSENSEDGGGNNNGNNNRKAALPPYTVLYDGMVETLQTMYSIDTTKFEKLDVDTLLSNPAYATPEDVAIPAILHRFTNTNFATTWITRNRPIVCKKFCLNETMLETLLAEIGSGDWADEPSAPIKGLGLDEDGEQIVLTFDMLNNMHKEASYGTDGEIEHICGVFANMFTVSFLQEKIGGNSPGLVDGCIEDCLNLAEHGGIKFGDLAVKIQAVLEKQGIVIQV